MANATDAQVQHTSDQRVRPFCSDTVLLVLRGQNLKANFDDTYAALTQQSPTWNDQRTDGVPHLALGSDLLAVNTFVTNLVNVITTRFTDRDAALAAVQAINDQWPIIQKLPINPVPNS